MQHITRTMASHYRHAYRPGHAKSHGILVGELEVLQDLPEHLAQGIFATTASYPVIMRFSTNPGDLFADTVSSSRGLAMKVLGVPGEAHPIHAGHQTQDFICVDADAFSAPDPAGFLKQIQLFDKNLGTPEGVKHAFSLTARATNAVTVLQVFRIGKLASAWEMLIGRKPKQAVIENLRHFKAFAKTEVIPRNQGQPHGPRGSIGSKGKESLYGETIETPPTVNRKAS